MILAAGKSDAPLRLRTSQAFRVTSKVNVVSLSYEITQEESPSEELTAEETMFKYPSKIGSFDEKQATDGSYMHLVVDAHLVNSKGNQVGRPKQLYIGFKKIDLKADEQLQVNA